MKNLFLIIAVLFTLTASAQTESGPTKTEHGIYYCVQVCATRNPELLKPEMVSILPDTALVEQSGEWFRIMFVYATREEAEIMHTSWLKQWHGAIIVQRTEKQIQGMFKLFSEI